MGILTKRDIACNEGITDSDMASALFLICKCFYGLKAKCCLSSYLVRHTIELWWAGKMQQNLCSDCLSVEQDGLLSQSIKTQRKLGQHWPHVWAKMHIYCWPFLQVRLSSHSQLPVIQSITVVSVQGNDQILQISFSQWDLPWPDDVPKLLPGHCPVFVFISLSKQVQQTQSLVLQVLLYNSQCSRGGVVDGWHTSILSSYRGVLFNRWGRSRCLYESNNISYKWHCKLNVSRNFFLSGDYLGYSYTGCYYSFFHVPKSDQHQHSPNIISI